MKKIMMDTDVLLELLEKKDPEYKPVAKILSEKNKLKVKVFFSTITLYNIMGQKVKSIVKNKMFSAGYHYINFDANNFASGTYFVRIQTKEFNKSIKILLLK